MCMITYLYYKETVINLYLYTSHNLWITKTDTSWRPKGSQCGDCRWPFWSSYRGLHGQRSKIMQFNITLHTFVTTKPSFLTYAYSFWLLYCQFWYRAITKESYVATLLCRWKNCTIAISCVVRLHLLWDIDSHFRLHYIYHSHLQGSCRVVLCL